MKKVIGLFAILLSGAAYADDMPFAVAMANVRKNCSGISDAMAHLKTMAGINTAVSAVGTIAGGGALGTGIAKIQYDKASDATQSAIDDLNKVSTPSRQVYSDEQVIQLKQELKDLVAKEKEKIKEKWDTLTAEQQKQAELETLIDVKAQIDKKSKTLGNARTGLMATSAATNIAGAVIAGTNKIDDDLNAKINACMDSVASLSNARNQARVDGSASPEELSQAEKIISACGAYDTVDMAKINKRATGGMVSSTIGATTAVVGTVTSGMANSDNVRNGDAKKEQNLNAASNVLAGATTVASGAATIFNGTQIAAIKKVSDIADACEGAIK